MELTPQITRSLVATKDIKAEEVIATIPYSKLLRNTDITNSPIYAKMEEAGLFKSPDEGGLL